MDSKKLQEAIEQEKGKFQAAYSWLEAHMPPPFFEELSPEKITLVAHSFVSFDLQDRFAEVKLKTMAIVLCLESSDADLKVLSRYKLFCIRGYRAFVSNAHPPGNSHRLKIAILNFKEHFPDETKKIEELLPQASLIFSELKERIPELSLDEFHSLIKEINPRFLRSLTKERLVLVLKMYFQAKTKDPCQYAVKKNEDWKEKKETPSLQIVLAWKNVPKHHFLYRLAKVIYQHNLQITRVNASYINSAYAAKNIMLLSLGLHGVHGKACWEETDLADFLQELVTVKYFEKQGTIDETFIDSGLVTGNMGHLLKAMVPFIHQALVHKDPNMYSVYYIEEGLCRHPELTTLLCKLFTFRFHPQKNNKIEYQKLENAFLEQIAKLDTGSATNDERRRNILQTAFHFIIYTLKTNFYSSDQTALCFRLDPEYLNQLPYDRKEKFPELPFAIFFMKGLHFFGFHIRFKDLSRGGLRTVCPEKREQYIVDRNLVFSECYNLAYTQQKKK